MKRSKYNKIINPKYQHGDPRRNEPPPNSIKRIGVNWRQRWHATLDVKYFKSEREQV